MVPLCMCGLVGTHREIRARVDSHRRTRPDRIARTSPVSAVILAFTPTPRQWTFIQPQKMVTTPVCCGSPGLHESNWEPPGVSTFRYSVMS